MYALGNDDAWQRAVLTFSVEDLRKMNGLATTYLRRGAEKTISGLAVICGLYSYKLLLLLVLLGIIVMMA